MIFNDFGHGDFEGRPPPRVIGTDLAPRETVIRLVLVRPRGKAVERSRTFLARQPAEECLANSRFLRRGVNPAAVHNSQFDASAGGDLSSLAGTKKPERGNSNGR